MIAVRDAPEVFDDVEEALDQVALPVEREVAAALDLAIGFRRDDRGDGAHFEAFDEGVRVVSLVGEQGFRLALRDQPFSLLDVVDLAEEWTWPPVRLTAKGLPSASTMAWIFVVSPPREWPMAWSDPLF